MTLTTSHTEKTTLSIVIVNYNVKYFLEQCLKSVFESTLTNLALEVWVVDNNSVDGSVEMIREKFPQVKLIANNFNGGFAKANNQALKQVNGDYLLLLNPDTIVEPDTFEKCVEFMQEHPDCGGLGVKMINGEGVYLKESKRGFPTPETSFYKISGLIHLFPHNKKVAAYYMGHLSEDKINEIEILPGAFLMFSRTAFDKVGLLDESYFMYGEDIDFSWRIKLAGFKNYYLPTTRIIHYKGESTKKGSLNYVYTFYNAMIIFTKRYFVGGNAKLYIWLIHIAIWLRALLAWIKRIATTATLPLIDFMLAWGGFALIKNLWATYWAENIGYYPPIYTFAVMPLYVLIIMLACWLNGGYDKPIKIGRLIKGVMIGAALLLVFYSMLDESQRYSRALLLLGSAWTLIEMCGLRGVLSLIHINGYQLREPKRKGCIIVGNQDEYNRIKTLYDDLNILCDEITQVEPSELNKLSEIIRVYHADEVIFCSKDIPLQEIITQMQNLQRVNVEYKIAPEESDFVIGSNTINSREDLYTIELNTINTPMNQRNKRLFDVCFAMLFIIFSPILFWVQHRKKQYYSDCIKVLIGKKSWVHPTIGIFKPKDILPGRHLDEERMNLRYLKNYKVSTDFTILWRNINKI